MQEAGFEPAKALSHQILSLAPLTAWVLLRTFFSEKFDQNRVKGIDYDSGSRCD